MTTVLAIDIGATKFAAGIIRADGTLLRRIERPTGNRPTDTLTELVTAIDPNGVDAVGIGTAGPLDRDRGTVSPVNIPYWRTFPLTATVAELVPGVPVALAGDAQCMALGEWWRTRPTVRALLGVVVSTGIGGGLVLDGRPYLGPTGNAGHLGHITVAPDGETCPCGATGCVETIASGPSMVRWALGHGWTPAGEHGGAPDARTLAADARRGVPIARAAFTRAAEALADALLTTAALCDIDEVVVGGGVSAAGSTLIRPIHQALSRRHGMPFLRRLRISATRLGRDAGLYGAAALALAPAPATTGEPCT
jgi:glucokinase